MLLAGRHVMFLPVQTFVLAGKPVECVFVSSDRDEDQFKVGLAGVIP